MPTDPIRASSHATPAGAPERNSLVLIRKGGNKPAFFLVHDGQGETMLYLNLARRLDPGHAVYGLQPRSGVNSPIMHTRTVEMAAYHIEKIRSVQPCGPYLLGGLCVGGVIAYEIARQLQEKGEKVALVALLDAADVAATSRKWRLARKRIRSFSTAFHNNQSMRPGLFALAVAGRTLRKTANSIAFVLAQGLSDLMDAIRLRMLRYYTDRNRRLPRFLEGIPVQTVCLFAESQYRPETLLDGELMLYRSTSGQDADEPFVERYDDPLFGWSSRATGGVRAIDVPGGHFSMLQEPNVRVLADQITLYANRALADGSAAPSFCAVSR